MNFYDWLKIFSIVLDGVVLIRFVSAGMMCIYGCGWSRRLIANVSLGIGFSLGIWLTSVLLEAGAEEMSFLAIPIVAFVFYSMSYRSVTLNHFLALFLVVVKVSVLVIMFLAQNRMIQVKTSTLYLLPILLGIILGMIGCIFFNNYILLLCVSFIGATELVPKIMDLINGTLFATTAEFRYILSLDPAEIILSFLGIDIPSSFEIILILIIFIGSFYLQMYIVKRKGIDLTKAILDDTGDKVKIVRRNTQQ